MTDSSRRLTARLGQATIIAAIACATHPASAASDAEVEALKAQLRAMEARLLELEAKQAQTAETAEETKRVVDEETIKSGGSLGTFVLPGTDTRVSIGGYAKGDFIYDLGGSIGSDDLFVPETIVIGGDNDPKFTAHARQSRLNVRTTTPSSFGPVKTLIEGDFFGVGGNEVISNSFSFRLRHAWGEVGPIAGGQFWTNFMPIEAYPRTVDFQGPAGIPFIRQAQVRWTQPVNDNLTVRFSLENSEFSGVAEQDDDGDGLFDPATESLLTFGESVGPLAGIAAGIDVAPDAVLTAQYRGDFGLVHMSGVARYFGGQPSATGDGDGEFGWGLNAAGSFNVTDSTRMLASVTGGDGVGRYIINGFAQDGVVELDGDINPIAALGVTGQLQQKLTEDFTAAIAYGRYDIFDNVSPGSVDTLQTLHASLFWAPIDRVTFGAEAIFGLIENQAGDDDSAVRLQTSIQVNF